MIMKKKKQVTNCFLAGLLAIALIVSMVPVTMLTTFAATTKTYSVTVTDTDSNLLEGAEVEIAGAEVIGESKKTTDAEGKTEFSIDISDGEPEEVRYSVAKIGYESKSDVFDDTGVASVALTAIPTGTVTGIVSL